MARQTGRERSLLIIGAGIAGLSAGAYARMNGYRTRIFELGAQPGGVCTSWRREGYTVDGCIHWLIGSAPGSSLHRMWLELGALQGRSFVYPEEVIRLEGLEGRSFTAPVDLDHFEARLLELAAPEDRQLVRRLVRTARALGRNDLPLDAPEVQGLVARLGGLKGMLSLLVRAREWLGLSVGQLASRFRGPLLREVLTEMWGEEISVVFLLYNLGFIGRRQAGYPLGGSLAFSRAIESRYLSLGGEVRYGARVTRILVEEGRAVGVRLENGEEHRADAVLSAADGHTTLFELLEGRYVGEELRRLYAEGTPFPGLVHVALGIRRRFEDMPYAPMGVHLLLEKPLQVAGQEHRRLSLFFAGHDPSLAPEGHTVVRSLIHTDHAAWAALGRSPERYAEEKERIVDQVIAALDARFPGLASLVEMRDVATPLTYERYTGNWKGAYEGWLPTPRMFPRRVPNRLEGLGSFYMAGQWVQPGGGVPLCALSGRQAIQRLCAADGRRFEARLPGQPSETGREAEPVRGVRQPAG